MSAPSRASLMTGQHTGHCEVRGNKEYWKNVPKVKYLENEDFSIVGQHPYDPDHIILPEIMKDNGYNTGMLANGQADTKVLHLHQISEELMSFMVLYANFKHISIIQTS